MLELFSYPFVWRALIAVVVASLVSSVVGVFTVLRGFSTLSAAITHSSFAGASIAVIYGVNPLIGALALSLGFSGLTAYASESERRADVVIGMIFGFSTALAVLFLSLSSSYSAAAWSFIVGDVLGVSWLDLQLLVVVAAVAMGVIFLFYKEFKFITFDPEAAEAMGLRVRFYHYVMVFLVALFSVVAIKVVGVILAIVLLIAPAASAYEFSHDLERMMAASIVIALASGILGLVLSILLNVASSALIGIAVSIAYLASLIASPKRRKCKDIAKCRVVREL
ncbi:MAG: hypothetical protein DRJ68_06745 [Thermoprotei archaeon]|nr:MAG: hypothetical protein DRJ62_07850 [Thermoprotei archaeon]RLF18530.1 MAG: hypothetical protein DRJ68_06745 [Thermoprotei archaeon]